MTIEETYERLETIIEKYKQATKNSFESETKNGKRLYRSILNLLDELKQEQPTDELFDDDEYFSKPDDFYQKDEEIEEEKPGKRPLTMDDILGDDEDEIW